MLDDLPRVIRRDRDHRPIPYLSGSCWELTGHFKLQDMLEGISTHCLCNGIILHCRCCSLHFNWDGMRSELLRRLAFISEDTTNTWLSYSARRWVDCISARNFCTRVTIHWWGWIANFFSHGLSGIKSGDFVLARSSIFDEKYEKAHAEYKLLEYTIKVNEKKSKTESDVEHAHFARNVYKASQMTEKEYEFRIAERSRETYDCRAWSRTMYIVVNKSAAGIASRHLHRSKAQRRRYYERGGWAVVHPSY